MSALSYNILLIGFMGTGKSTIARKLARQLSLKEADIDALIVKQAGKPITDIFAEEGEAYFRKLETETLQSLQQQQGLIISCGGGLAMQEHNHAIMQEHGVVVLLTASPRTILRRVGTSTHRPLLNGKMNIKDISKMMNQRSPMYQKAAEIVVSTDRRTVAQICREITAQLEQFDTSQK